MKTDSRKSYELRTIFRRGAHPVNLWCTSRFYDSGIPFVFLATVCLFNRGIKNARRATATPGIRLPTDFRRRWTNFSCRTAFLPTSEKNETLPKTTKTGTDGNFRLAADTPQTSSKINYTVGTIFRPFRQLYRQTERKKHWRPDPTHKQYSFEDKKRRANKIFLCFLLTLQKNHIYINK